jgi:hypothetical protein
VPFRLTKWYLDAVSPEGDVFIGYCAEAGWDGISLRYSSSLIHLNGAPAVTKTSLRRCTGPDPRGDEIRWQPKHLGVSGLWKGPRRGFAETVYSGDEGAVRWECLLPLAEAVISLDGSGTVAGLGYVERLEMTVAPWHMPIRELRWGRCLTGADSLVWMDWRGAYNRRIVYRNGAAAEATEIGDNTVLLSDGTRLLFDRSLSLRDGDLGSTVLRAIPGIKRLAPARILSTRECKWRSRGTWLEPGCAPRQGWAIHEVVQWP